MNFMQWFKGYGANREMEFENDKLKKELIELKRVREKSLNDMASYRMEHAKTLGKYVKELEEKDKQMASWMEEVARLKKLIELNRDRSKDTVGTPPVKPANKDEDTRKKKHRRGTGNDRSE